MSPHMPNCTLNDFYVLTLPLAMGSDVVPRNLQRHLHASLWIMILCRLGVFTSAIEEKITKEEKGTEVTLLSYCRLQTVRIFAQATGTVEVRALKDGTVVNWLLLPRNLKSVKRRRLSPSLQKRLTFTTYWK